MDTYSLIAIVVLVLAVAFWALWNRRDRGDIPANDIAESPAPGRNQL